MQKFLRIDFKVLLIEMLLGFFIALSILLILAASLRPVDFVYRGY